MAAKAYALGVTLDAQPRIYSSDREVRVNAWTHLSTCARVVEDEDGRLRLSNQPHSLFFKSHQSLFKRLALVITRVYRSESQSARTPRIVIVRTHLARA
jgi:hypothetical protein